MKLHLRALSSNEFTWSKESKSFSAEMSDFRGVDRDLFQRIYDDACDTGFAMYSERTGTTETFYFSKEIFSGRGEDRELAGWEFLPLNKELADLGIKVVIFND
jgi:hypothetical protein